MNVISDLPEQANIVVIGAGIGGLAVARALGRRGHETLVLERTARIEPAGAGIVLAANATAALAALGLDATTFGCPLASMNILTAGGQPLTQLSLERLAAEVGPVVAAHRAALHAALAADLPNVVSVGLGVTLCDLVQDDGAVTLTALDSMGRRQVLRAKLVIGADGLHSQVRRTTAPTLSLRYSGETCWRAIVRGVAVAGASESWGCRTRVGVVPLPPQDGGPRVYTFWTAFEPAGAPTLPFSAVVERFAEFRGDARRVLDATEAESVIHHDLWELSRPTWGAGRVWLLGDAAHGMTPNQGQGASMAIEDALAVAQSLGGKELSRTALSEAHRRYVSMRNARVQRVQLDSRRFGQVAGWRSRVLVGLRTLALRLTPDRVVRGHYRELVRAGLELAAIERAQLS